MTLNKILKGLIITGVFSLFIVPFLVPSNMFFPFITGKGFFFRAVIEIIFAAWIILSFRDASVRPRKSLLLWSSVAFVVIIGLADLFGHNPWKSFWSNFERMEGYITTLHLFMYFIVASAVLASERVWKRWLEWSVWSSLIVVRYSFLQLAGKIPVDQGGVRVDATFGNATYLAIYMVFNIFFALILIARDRQEANAHDRHLWKPIAYGIIAALECVILYYTATRGSILGLIGGVLLAALIIALFDRADRRLRITAVSVIAVVIVLVGGFVGIRNTSFVQHSPVLSRFASISWGEESGQARGYIWPMAVQGWLERPILGWGQENFNYIFNADYAPQMWSQEQWFDHAHNAVLDWLVAGGTLGLLAYLSLFVTALWLLWRRSNEVSFTEKALFTGLFAAYFFHNLFVFDNIMSYIMFFSLLAMIHWRAARLEKPIADGAEEAEGDDMKMVIPVVLIALVFCLYFFNWRGYETNVTLIDGLQALNAGQPAAAVSALQTALSYDTLGHPEVVERVVQAASSINTASVPIDVRQQFADMAKKAVDDQVAWFPDDARYQVFAGTFYGMYGDIAGSEQHLLAAVALSPRKQTILFQLGNLYIAAKQYDKAVETFKKAYDLDHTYGNAADLYAASLIYAGQDAQAEAFLSSTGQAAAPGDSVLKAYLDTSAWSKAIAILKARLAANPADTQSLQNLAVAYYRAGDKANAIATVQKLESVDPTAKAQGDRFIQQIQAGK